MQHALPASTFRWQYSLSRLVCKACISSFAGLVLNFQYVKCDCPASADSGTLASGQQSDHLLMAAVYQGWAEALLQAAPPASYFHATISLAVSRRWIPDSDNLLRRSDAKPVILGNYGLLWEWTLPHEAKELAFPENLRLTKSNVYLSQDSGLSSSISETQLMIHHLWGVHLHTSLCRVESRLQLHMHANTCSASSPWRHCPICAVSWQQCLQMPDL